MFTRILCLSLSLSFFQLVHAQFPTIKWDYELSAPAFGSAAAADMDNDGLLEIVFSTYTNDGKAHCLNAEDGSVSWIYDLGGCGDVAPIIYDMNNDDTLDVVINGSCNPTVFCINGATGSLIWSKASGGGDSPPTVADVDGDGLPEVLFGNFNGEVRVLNGEDGSIAKIIQADPHSNPIQTAPTLVDVNQDQRLDIIVASYFNVDGLYIWAFDYQSGDTLWTDKVIDPNADFHVYHGGAVADIDNDDRLEYVVGSGNGTIRALNVEDGSERWNVAVPTNNIAALSIADFDNNGQLEVVFVNNDPVTFDTRIRVLAGATGALDWSYPVDFSSFRGAAISDINSNGQLDLITGHFLGSLRAVEPYSGLIWELDLKDQLPPNLPWSAVDHGPLIADFDQNGTIDVFVVAGYGTYTPDSQNTGRAFMIEAGEGTCPEWLMFRHDIRRTGYLSQEEVTEACDLPNAVYESEEDADWIQLVPNPAGDQFSLQVNSSAIQVNSIEIISSSGQRLFQHSYDGLPITTASLSSGLYLIKLKTENSYLYKKLVVER